MAFLAALRDRVLAAWREPPIRHGGERVLVRFAVGEGGELRERCVRGATSPRAARSAVAAFDAVFPIAPPRAGARCLVDVPLSVRFEIETE